MRNFRTITLVSLLLIVPTLAFSQAPPAALSFEVATIKPAEPINPQAILTTGKLPHVGMSVEGSRVDIGYMSLADLIPTAFNVKPYQISGPDWMSSQRFDILARMPEGTTKEQVPQMLQALLIERFQLKVHRESRDLPIYALIVAKGGPKLKESTPDPETPAEPPKGAVTLGAGTNAVSVNTSSGGATVTTAQGGTMKMAMGTNG